MSSLSNRSAVFQPFPPLFPQYLLYLLTAAVVTILPLLVWRWSPAFIRHTYGEAYEPFELFGFFAGAAIILHTVRALRKELGSTQSLTWSRVLPILVPAALLFFFLNLIVEYSIPSWDYRCYERAATAFLNGGPLYNDCYLYPPLLAQSLAWAEQWLLGTFVTGGEELISWSVVYYLFQCLQFFALALLYPLCYRLARRLGFQKMTAVFLVAILLLFNTPLLRTIRHTQVNVIVLDLFLLGLLLADRLPWLSGFSAALGIHLKLYPAVLFIPWFLTKRWRAILFGLLGLGLLVLVSASWGQDWEVWEQFIVATREFPPGNHFRDNSLHSLIFNGLALIAVPLGMAGETVRSMVSIIVLILYILLGGWVMLRLFQRYQAFKSDHFTPDSYYLAQAMDSWSLSLLLAPRVWEHHYLLAVPIVLWGAAVAGKKRPWLVGTAAFLMLSLTVFDIYPLSYHRLAGLLLLLYSTTPSNSTSNDSR